MKKLKLLAISIILIQFTYCTTPNEFKEKNSSTTASKVVLKTNEKGFYRLFVNDSEFFIKGAGLEHGNIEALAQHGANSFRTWRTENGLQSGKEVLDEALKNNLMVFMGLEVGRERHGKDYNDEEWVSRQKEDIKKQILKYKDHPALLGWGIGNELNLRYTNKKVWDAVNDISKMIHEIDGNHPTTTMLSGIAKEDVDYIKTHCQDLDFISIQMYGDIINLQQRIAEAGYDGPYMVTEWGTTGHWEVGKTEWGAPIEENSTERANGVKERYEKAILIDSARCIGSFVFLWGQKQERTPTWYGLFTEAHEEITPIDIMHYFWNDNKWPANRTPEIKAASLDGKQASESIHVMAGKEVEFAYNAVDPDKDEIKCRFEVMEEATDLNDGGDAEQRPNVIEGLLVSESAGKITFKAPEQTGAYRAFVYLLDGQNNAATVNIPFYVD